MSRRSAARLGWSLFAGSAALALAAGVLAVMNQGSPTYDGTSELVVDIGVGVGQLAFPLVGALIVSRDPGNSIGWLFCAVGVPFALGGLAHSWATYTLFENAGALPAGELAAWLGSWVFVPPLFAVPSLLFLLFPDGRPPSPRWRPVGWLVGFGIVAASAGSALAPGSLSEPPFRRIQNPLGIDGARLVLDVIATVGFLALFATVLLGAAAIVIRFRRSVGEERLQLKWVATAGALFALACIVYIAPFSPLPSDTFGQALILLAFVGIPVAAGIAILKHRLYDIDVVIRRTLVYGALTATLGATYLALVLLAGLAVGESDVAIAGSTLAVAALFRPARARIQAVVDRRFYRRRYDAAVTLEGFSARVRDEIDLESLGAELRATVSKTVQPSQVSLWLR